MGAYNVTLMPQEDRQIRQATERAEVHGTRVAETLMGFLVMDTPSSSDTKPNMRNDCSCNTRGW